VIKKPPARCDGARHRTATLPRDVAGIHRHARRLATASITQAIGLATLGKPDGFLKRQITGWMARWEKPKPAKLPLMEKLGAWFLDNMPVSPPPVLVHNDFYLHNVMVGAVNHGEIVGVFDWEMSTIGDPLVDLGIVMNYWRDKNDPPELLGTSQGEAHTLRPDS